MVSINTYSQTSQKYTQVLGNGYKPYIPVFTGDLSKQQISNSTILYDAFERDTVLEIGSMIKFDHDLILNKNEHKINLGTLSKTARIDFVRENSLYPTGKHLMTIMDDDETQVGIGTDLPSANLDVVGSIETDQLRIKQNALSGRVLLCDDADGNAKWADLTSLGASPWQTNGTDIYYLDQVAIGKSSAFYALDVDGTVAANMIRTNDGLFTNNVQVQGNFYSFDGTIEQATIGDITMDNASLSFKNGSYSLLKLNDNNSIDLNGVVNANTLRVAHDVEIGETYTANLYVNGRVEAKEVLVVPTINWPDYVFADNYQLRSLHELETFIQQNKHLPGIPDEQTVKSEGIELSEMNAKLLEKVEEMTLYLIEQNKKLQKQGDELKALKEELKTLQDEK